jgi:hypothetical protein
MSAFNRVRQFPTCDSLYLSDAPTKIAIVAATAGISGQ